MHMHRQNAIWSLSPRKSDEFLSSISSVLTDYEQHLSTVMKTLITKLKLPKPYKHPTKPQLPVKEHAVVPEKVPKESVLPSPSAKTIKRLKVEISQAKAKFSCNIGDCTHCDFLLHNAPISRCTHPKPHANGWFVHVPRKVSRKYHATHNQELCKAVVGYPNPMLLEDKMDIEPVALPAPVMPTAISKSPKPIATVPLSRSSSVSSFCSETGVTKYDPFRLPPGQTADAARRARKRARRAKNAGTRELSNIELMQLRTPSAPSEDSLRAFRDYCKEHGDSPSMDLAPVDHD